MTACNTYDHADLSFCPVHLLSINISPNLYLFYQCFFSAQISSYYMLCASMFLKYVHSMHCFIHFYSIPVLFESSAASGLFLPTTLTPSALPAHFFQGKCTGPPDA